MKSVSHRFAGNAVSVDNYDKDKTNVGQFIVCNSGEGYGNNFAGPINTSMARPSNISISNFPFNRPRVIKISNNIYWVFLADSNPAATTKRIMLCVYNKSLNKIYAKGVVGISSFPSGNHSIIDFDVYRYLYTVGQVTVSNSVVTGIGTLWDTDKLSAGARIGFGSNDPNQITNWYDISTLSGTNTSLTINGVVNIGSPVPYVIEEIRVFILTSSSTLTNSGIACIYGINYDTFNLNSSTGDVLPAITSGRTRGVYYVTDNTSSPTMTSSYGIVLGPMVDWNTHYLYCLNGTNGSVSAQIFAFNVRNQPGVVSGRTSALLAFKTAIVGTLTLSTSYNLEYATPQHGPEPNEPCLFFVATTAVYRCPIRLLYENSSLFTADHMRENYIGNSLMYGLFYGSSFNKIAYDPTNDVFIIGSSVRSFVVKYNTDSSYKISKFVFMRSVENYTTSALDFHPVMPVFASTNIFSFNDGMMFISRGSTSTTLNQIFVLHAGADWDYASNNDKGRLISPILSLNGIKSFCKLYVNYEKSLGSEPFVQPTEPWRAYVRTTGFDDNSGEWKPVPQNGSLVNIDVADKIQVMFEFRVLGLNAIPSRIYGFSVFYNDYVADNHYKFCMNLSDPKKKIFVWKHEVSFGGPLTSPLKIKLFNENFSEVLYEDSSNSPKGIFSRSIDGGITWSNFTNDDKANNLTFIRYKMGRTGFTEAINGRIQLYFE